MLITENLLRKMISQTLIHKILKEDTSNDAQAQDQSKVLMDSNVIDMAIIGFQELSVLAGNKKINDIDFFKRFLGLLGDLFEDKKAFKTEILQEIYDKFTLDEYSYAKSFITSMKLIFSFINKYNPDKDSFNKFQENLPFRRNFDVEGQLKNKSILEALTNPQKIKDLKLAIGLIYSQGDQKEYQNSSQRARANANKGLKDIRDKLLKESYIEDLIKELTKIKNDPTENNQNTAKNGNTSWFEKGKDIANNIKNNALGDARDNTEYYKKFMADKGQSQNQTQNNKSDPFAAKLKIVIDSQEEYNKDVAIKILSEIYKHFKSHQDLFKLPAQHSLEFNNSSQYLNDVFNASMKFNSVRPRDKSDGLERYKEFVTLYYEFLIGNLKSFTDNNKPITADEAKHLIKLYLQKANNALGLENYEDEEDDDDNDDEEENKKEYEINKAVDRMTNPKLDINKF